MAQVFAGGPTLVMGNVQTLPLNTLPDPATMSLLEVGHSTAITVNAGKSQGTGWIIWVRHSQVLGEIAILETWIQPPGAADWQLQNIEQFEAQPVIKVGGQPFYGTSITNQDFKAGTQLLINCPRVDSVNWLYLAVAAG